LDRQFDVAVIDVGALWCITLAQRLTSLFDGPMAADAAMTGFPRRAIKTV
jgi:hypothetical protein